MANETDLFRRALAAAKSREQLHAELKQGERAGLVRKFGLPTTLRSGRRNLPLAPTRIHTPDGDAVQGTPDNVCGDCSYFDLENGQKEIIRQRFAEKLVREHEWALRHLGAPIDNIGLCGASGGEMATTFVSPACDQFRPKKAKGGR